MTVLSDLEIRALISSGQLVPEGDLSKVSACAYEFRPGTVLRTGQVEDTQRVARDWTDGTSLPTDGYDIPPGELVWVRTRESVRMPENVCAFWWQTNTLSKQGLMLVNMSMVEPGYQGPLACLFMNFGQRAVEIGPDSIVAKLVFMSTGQVDSPLDLTLGRDKYDRDLVSAAKASPQTFLDIARFSQESMAQQIRTESDKAIEVSKFELQRSLAAATEELEKSRDEFRSDLQSDAKSQLIKVLGGAAAGFALVVLAITFIPWLQSSVKPNLSEEIKGEVNKVLTERLSVPTELDDLKSLQRQIRELEDEVRRLQSRDAANPSRP
jgi:deoxycytidine triphosphate deaminase